MHSGYFSALLTSVPLKSLPIGAVLLVRMVSFSMEQTLVHVSTVLIFSGNAVDSNYKVHCIKFLNYRVFKLRLQCSLYQRYFIYDSIPLHPPVSKLLYFQGYPTYLPSAYEGYQLCYSMVGKYRTLGTFFMSIEARS